MTTSPQPTSASNPADLPSVALSIGRGIEILRADPLARFQFACERQRRFAAALGRCEIYLHAANKWGKTTLGAACGIAMARGLRSLAGTPLPRLPVPNVGLVLSLDYTQQRLSVQRAYLRLVGDWPHLARYEGDVLKVLRVKPEGGSDDIRTWSEIHFLSAKNLQSGMGARANWLHADEPPPESLWRELRKAGEPGSPFPRFITATALFRSQWWWLRADYPPEHEGVEANGYLRLRGPVYENSFLTAADVRELERLYATDLNRKARLYGFEADTAGASPFHKLYDVLNAMLGRCVPGDMQEITVERERITDHGMELAEETCSMEVWGRLEPTHVYRVVMDPSDGIDDGEHDPCEADVLDMTSGKQVARYSGYVGEFGLGMLGGKLCEDWRAWADPASTAGYGKALLSGLRASGCQRITSSLLKMPQSGLTHKQAGFVETIETRKEHVAAIQEALLWESQGRGYMHLNSAATVAELMDLMVDKKGRVVPAPGRHDEALVCIGRFATLIRPGQPHRETALPLDRSTPRGAGRRRLLESMGLAGTNGHRPPRQRTPYR